MTISEGDLESLLAVYGDDAPLIAPDEYFAAAYPDVQVTYGRMPVPLTISALIEIEDNMRKNANTQREHDPKERRVQLYVGMLAAAGALSDEDSRFDGMSLEAIGELHQAALQEYGLQ